ncbi:MAG: ComEC family competence protein [Phycisphaerales bacterium]|nr:ComEC family competence protein [Planctomycetota bacterium]
MGARIRAGISLACVCVGIAIGWELPGSLANTGWTGVALLILGAGLAGLSLALPRRVASALVCLGLLAASSGWSVVRLREPPAGTVGAVVSPADGAVVVRVLLLEDARGSEKSWSALAECREIWRGGTGEPAGGRVWLRVRSGQGPARRAGDRLIVRGEFEPVAEPGNPGEFDLARWARDRGIDGSLRVQSDLMVRPDESLPGVMDRVQSGALRIQSLLRARAGAIVAGALGNSGNDERELIGGLLLGTDPATPGEGLLAFYRLGMAHVLSISGFHLVVFAGAMLLLLRIFGDLGRLEPVLMAAAICVFLLLVPASAPLVRAAAILLTLLAAEALGRRYDGLTLLAWLACVVLIVRPSELWSLGFQLSFGLAGALVGLSGRLQGRLFPAPLGQNAVRVKASARVLGPLRGLVVTGILCWGLSAPWLAAQVGIFNPLAIITGIVVTPLVALILWVGYGVLLAGVLVPPLAPFAGVVLGGLASRCVAIVLWFDSLPGATVRLASLSLWWAGAATLLLVVWFAIGRLRVRGCWVFACLLAIWGACELGLGGRLAPGVEMRINVLALDRGKCAIVRTRDKNVMVGAGGSARALPATARELGAWKIDALILDPRDADSMRGAVAAIKCLAPDEMILEGASEAMDDPALTELVSQARMFRVRVRWEPDLESALKAAGTPEGGPLLSPWPKAEKRMRTIEVRGAARGAFAPEKDR